MNKYYETSYNNSVTSIQTIETKKILKRFKKMNN